MINVFGIDNSYAPLSNAFSIDIINNSCYLSRDIKSINKMNISIKGEYLNTYTILDKYFSSIFLNINIRIDYVSMDNILSYEILKVDKIIDICTKDIEYKKDVNIHTGILDADIVDIKKSRAYYYVLIACSLC